MNLAAAGATPAFTLFGATPVLTIRASSTRSSRRGTSPDGMTRIMPAQVMARIEPYLELPSFRPAWAGPNPTSFTLRLWLWIPGSGAIACRRRALTR